MRFLHTSRSIHFPIMVGIFAVGKRLVLHTRGDGTVAMSGRFGVQSSGSHNKIGALIAFRWFLEGVAKDRSTLNPGKATWYVFISNRTGR